MKTRSCSYLSALILLGALHSGPLALAQDKHDVGTAELLFDEGLQLMSQGNYTEACEKFAASHRLDPSVGALLNEANCREKLGQTASAWVLYREARSQARKLGDRKRLRIARKQARKLEKTLSYMTIQVPGESLIEGLVISRNGHAIVDAAWNQRIPMDPGQYEIRVEAPGRESWSTVVEVGAEGEHAMVAVPSLAVRVPKPVAPETVPMEEVVATKAADEGDKGVADEDAKHGENSPKAKTRIKPRQPNLESSTAEPRSAPWPWQRKMALGVGTAGLASLVTGGIFGMQARSRWNEALTHCGPDRTQCDAQGVALGDEAGQWATRANILVAAGVVAVGTGAVLWMVSRNKRRTEKNDRTAIIPLIAPESAGIGVTGEF